MRFNYITLRGGAGRRARHLYYRHHYCAEFDDDLLPEMVGEHGTSRDTGLQGDCFTEEGCEWNDVRDQGRGCYEPWGVHGGSCRGSLTWL